MGTILGGREEFNKRLPAVVCGQVRKKVRTPKFSKAGIAIYTLRESVAGTGSLFSALAQYSAQVIAGFSGLSLQKSSDGVFPGEQSQAIWQGSKDSPGRKAFADTGMRMQISIKNNIFMGIV